MRTMLSLFVLAFVFAPASSAQDVLTQPDALKAIEQGQAYLLQGNLSAAERQFQQVLAIYEKNAAADNPDLATVLNSLATVERLRGKYAEATSLSRRSLAVLEKVYGAQHPNVAIGQNNLAMNLRLRGDYEEARILSQRAVSILEKALGPQHINVGISLNNLVQAYVGQRDFAQAEPLARRSLSIFDKTPGEGWSNLLQSLENLAEICQQLEKVDEAEQLYRRVLSVRWGNGADIVPVLERFADVLNLAFLEMPLKEARQRFESEPGWRAVGVDLYIAMARALRDRGLAAEPENVILRAIQAFPNSLEARYELAQTYAGNLKFRAALDTLEQTGKVQGTGNPRRDRYLRSLVYQEIARMDVLLVQFSEAVSNLETAVSLDPGNATALVDLGDLYRKLDRPEDAAAEYGKAILLTGGNAAAYYGIAEANLRLARYPQAVIAADKALEINPGDTRSSYVRSAALLRDGHREEGETELQRLRQLETKDRDQEVRARAIPVTLRMAAASFEDHQEEKALEGLRESIHSYPDSPSLQLNLGIMQSRLGRHRDAMKTFEAMIDKGFQDQSDFLIHLNLSREYEFLGDRRASQLQRLIYLQKYDAFLKNKRK